MRHAWLGTLVGGAVALGCASLLGLDDFTDRSGASGGSGASGASGASGGSSGSGAKGGTSGVGAAPSGGAGGAAGGGGAAGTGTGGEPSCVPGAPFEIFTSKDVPGNVTSLLVLRDATSISGRDYVAVTHEWTTTPAPPRTQDEFLVRYVPGDGSLPQNPFYFDANNRSALVDGYIHAQNNELLLYGSHADVGILVGANIALISDGGLTNTMTLTPIVFLSQYGCTTGGNVDFAVGAADFAFSSVKYASDCSQISATVKQSFLTGAGSTAQVVSTGVQQPGLIPTHYVVSANGRLVSMSDDTIRRGTDSEMQNPISLGISGPGEQHILALVPIVESGSAGVAVVVKRTNTVGNFELAVGNLMDPYIDTDIQKFAATSIAGSVPAPEELARPTFGPSSRITVGIVAGGVRLLVLEPNGTPKLNQVISTEAFTRVGAAVDGTHVLLVGFGLEKHHVTGTLLTCPGL